MAKTTPKYALPYPDPEDVPDIAGDIQKLALATDGMIGNGLVSGVWGSGSMAGFPSDSKLGTPVYLDSLNQLRARPTPTIKHAVDPLGSYGANFKADPGTNSRYWVQWGPLIAMQLAPYRITSDLLSNADGNIGNALIGTLRSDVPKPAVTQTFINGWVGAVAGINVSTTGAVAIANFGNNVAKWGINSCWPLFLFYMTNDVVQL
jgi:hypothetical protein